MYTVQYMLYHYNTTTKLYSIQYTANIIQAVMMAQTHSNHSISSHHIVASTCSQSVHNLFWQVVSFNLRNWLPVHGKSLQLPILHSLPHGVVCFRLPTYLDVFVSEGSLQFFQDCCAIAALVLPCALLLFQLSAPHAWTRSPFCT